MSGTLFVVATPIGNLEDITLRALRVLREVDLIAAEDTRRTAKLLTHYAISTPTLSFHEHNTRTRIPQIVDRLRAGANIALVTDAGTPGVSDPGVELVQAASAAGFVIDVIPGPSAALTGAVASGFPLEPFTILGFPPAKGQARRQWFAELAAIPHTVSFFESPHRIAKTLSELGRELGNRPICVARELTKAHQEFTSGPAISFIGRMTVERGEFTIIVGPVAAETEATNRVTDQQIAHEFGELTKSSGLSRRPAVAAIARKHRIPSREVYSIIERTKSSV